MRLSNKSSLRTLGEYRWDSPLMTRQKPTTRPSLLDYQTHRENKPNELVKTPINREERKTNNRLSQGIVSVFCTQCRKTGHNVFNCWSIKRQENGGRFDRSQGQADSNHSPSGNKVNVVEFKSREILSLEESSTDEVLYNVQDARTWLLDSGVTFHVTPNVEWFSNYSVRTSDTV